MQLKNKTALITGGSTGIGFGIAKRFAQEGARVIITGRHQDKLKAACENIEGDVRYFVADVCDREKVRACVAWVLEACSAIDILVNNAGVNIVDRSLQRLTPDGWDYVMRINADGVFNCIHAVLPHMRERKDGVIITISSIAGLRAGVLGGAAYNASKHAAAALTKTVGLEEKDNGIRCTVIYPGEVDTPILDDRPEPVSDAHRARILKPDDVAAAALFVAALPPHVNVPELVIKPTTQEYA
ncbi:MAG: SDR family oxidoreductase [Abditibacteriales bacterium]|nr:SDR family oxidoreductase [Abditibacteriales bacterium]MDW8367697.1 SDR family oxidoreductase [Abditibacteriales bacterium]